MSLYVGDRQVCTFGWKPSKPAHLMVTYLVDILAFQMSH